MSRPPTAGTSTVPASITRSIERTEECTSSLTATRRAGLPACRARSRAACSAERLPTVPPCTKQPAAPAGKPARSASQRSASFSACTAPAPSTHEPPYTENALAAKSASAAAGVAAPGMNAM